MEQQKCIDHHSVMVHNTDSVYKIFRSIFYDIDHQMINIR